MSNFLSQNSIYIVFIIVALIWGGIYLFLNSIDKRLKKIENETERGNDEE